MTRPETNLAGTPREREVRALLAELSASGLSLAEFCTKRGIPRGTLSCWRTVIRRRDAVRAARVGVAPAASTGTKAASASPVPFVRVRVRPPRPPAPAVGTPLEVVLPGGLAVRVPVGFDAATLTDLLRVLEAA